MKYRPEFPDRFGCIQDARAFGQPFFNWYNDVHRHSGLGLHTPASVHYGKAAGIRDQRAMVLTAAHMPLTRSASSRHRLSLRPCRPPSGSTHPARRCRLLSNYATRCVPRGLTFSAAQC
jgi:putative transposase